ncbi:Cell wall / vacuolar inhibitor of fructosidase 1 [Bienertia sinuspersici]
MKPLSKNNLLLSHLLFFTTLVLFLCTTLTHAYSYSIVTEEDIVTTTCKQTPDPKLCESALRSDPRSSTTKDNQGLILIMIDVVKNRFSESLGYVEDLTRKTHDPDMKRALSKCIRVYRVVVDTSVDLAVRAVKQGVPKFGEQAMTDAGNEAEACWMAFPEGKAPGRIVDRTPMLHGVSNVAASMIKALE